MTIKHHKKKTSDEPRLVSYATDMATCTLNFEGREHYFILAGRSDEGPSGRNVMLMERSVREALMLMPLGSEERTEWFQEALGLVKDGDRDKEEPPLAASLRQAMLIMPTDTVERAQWQEVASYAINSFDGQTKNSLIDGQYYCTTITPEMDVVLRKTATMRYQLYEALAALEELKAKY